MTPLAGIATKGRPRETYALLDWLSRQTQSPRRIVVVGTEPADLAGLERHPFHGEGVLHLALSEKPGLTIQRNQALQVFADEGYLTGGRQSFVVFFDDDFRPGSDWLKHCGERFAVAPEIVGITGVLFADGVRGDQLTDAQADEYLLGQLPPQPHWSQKWAEKDVESLYGCNMAFVDDVAAACRFDECLPLYGWQEDCDYTGQARKFGRTIVEPRCVGVHLGTKAGRTSGLKFGYSQIANPIHIASNGHMPRARAAHFVMRALMANAIRSFGRHPLFDYRGRLYGNLRAIADITRGRCDPLRILGLS
jgi:hypothetical protein